MRAPGAAALRDAAFALYQRDVTGRPLEVKVDERGVARARQRRRLGGRVVAGDQQAAGAEHHDADHEEQRGEQAAQRGQVAASGEPQLSQNRLPPRFSVPQDAQIIPVLRGSRSGAYPMHATVSVCPSALA